MNSSPTPTFVVCLLLALPTVRANALANDGIDYPAGVNLNGQNGGSGWQSAWGSGGIATASTSSTDINYPNLNSTGGSISFNNRGNARDWGALAHTGNGDEVWFSLTVRMNPDGDGGSADDLRISLFADDTPLNGDATQLNLFNDGGIALTGGLSGTATGLSLNSNHFLVGRVTFSNSGDTVTI